MARLQDLRSTWDEYKGWFFLLFTVYCLWTFRKLFTAVGDTVGSAADAATAGAREAATNATDRKRVQSIVPALKNSAPSDASLAKWRADAATLAGYFGTDHFSTNTVVPDQVAAFSMLKQKYSRLLLLDNKPFHKVNGHNVSQDKETADSAKSPVNWQVLTPFYRDATGNDLLTDIRKHIKDIRVQTVLKWVI